MNCSQLLERRATTNWERPAQLTREFTERAEPQTAESYRWSAVRFSSAGQTFVPGTARPLKG
jgi:transcriptional regulator GlxA family with amidase domain